VMAAHAYLSADNSWPSEERCGQVHRSASSDAANPTDFFMNYQERFMELTHSDSKWTPMWNLYFYLCV
jgi:hypothetical protein